MSYTLAILWHERGRFWPGVLAVAFSAALIALQGGLLLGLFSVASLPVDRSAADIWVGSSDVPSVELGRPIPEAWLTRLAGQPEVARVETYLQGFTHWSKPHGGSELCCVLGAQLHDGALGAPAELTPDLRARLTEPGSVVVDESELERLGIRGVGDVAEIQGHRVRVVGLVRGLHGTAGPYVFCSPATARPLLGLRPFQTTYLLARCRRPADVPVVLARLRGYAPMSAFAGSELSYRSRVHWLTRTRAGTALGCAALLGLLVGTVVTAQTLSAATRASLREYAVLLALGIPRRRLVAVVLAQAGGVGLAGVAAAWPAVVVLAGLCDALGARVLLPAWLLGAASLVTLTVVPVAGLASLRPLFRAEPADLLR